MSLELGVYAGPSFTTLVIYVKDCSTGVTAQGKTPKTLVEEMVPLLDSREVMYVHGQKHACSLLIISATVTPTRSASLHCTSCTEKASQTRIADGCTNMRD